jgi:hypothetical protein
MPDGSEVREIYKNREDEKDADFKRLKKREPDDPIRLCNRVLEQLDHHFLIYQRTYLSGQRELLADAVKAVLQAASGTVTAIPFQPGLGKSTMIRALLDVCSQEFRDGTAIAQRLGGIIIVVEKTAEAEELEQLCNMYARDGPIATAISSPNDYNLARGKCQNGTAASFEEYRGRNCPDYNDCSLVQAAYQTATHPF